MQLNIAPPPKLVPKMEESDLLRQLQNVVVGECMGCKLKCELILFGPDVSTRGLVCLHSQCLQKFVKQGVDIKEREFKTKNIMSCKDYITGLLKAYSRYTELKGDKGELDRFYSKYREVIDKNKASQVSLAQKLNGWTAHIADLAGRVDGLLGEFQATMQIEKYLGSKQVTLKLISDTFLSDSKLYSGKLQFCNLQRQLVQANKIVHRLHQAVDVIEDAERSVVRIQHQYKQKLKNI